MLTKEQNDRLTLVGPGTAMGGLMRRYWHPIATMSQLVDRATMPVRLLCEDLVLYRDRSGILGLIEPTCPHRRMGMLYGVPETTGIRCAYHGWLFDETGRCLEQPYEEAEDPGSTYKDKVRAKTYPVREHGGMVWAYLGPQPAPLLPAFDLLVMQDVARDAGYVELPCNWLQAQENTLDPIHVEWLHCHFTNYVMEQLGRPEMARPRVPHVKIGFDVFPYGVIKRRVLEGASEEDDAWTVGHYALFPNYLRVGSEGNRIGGFQIRVPIDDTHTAHWYYNCYPRRPGEPEQRPKDVPLFKVPVPAPNEEGDIPWVKLDSAGAQDIVAWYTQGPVADRTIENLGRSDRGIILWRRLLEENLRRVEQGLDPMNVFRDPATNVYHRFATENSRMQQNNPSIDTSVRYSPLQAARREAARS